MLRSRRLRLERSVDEHPVILASLSWPLVSVGAFGSLDPAIVELGLVISRGVKRQTGE